MSEQNGGQAFPTTTREGMTLRDYFAGQVIGGTPGGWLRDEGSRNELARRAYQMADAMILAREASR